MTKVTKFKLSEYKYMTYGKYTNEKGANYKANEIRYKMIIYKMTIHKMKNLKKYTKSTNCKTSLPMKVLYYTFCTTGRMFLVNYFC